MLAFPYFPSSPSDFPPPSPKTQQPTKPAIMTNKIPDAAGKHPLLVKTSDLAYDLARVYRDGSEEDLRVALGVILDHIPELAALAESAMKARVTKEAEYATLALELSAARHNLKMVQNNNEMLEEALAASTPYDQTPSNDDDFDLRRASTPVQIQIPIPPQKLSFLDRLTGASSRPTTPISAPAYSPSLGHPPGNVLRRSQSLSEPEESPLRLELSFLKTQLEAAVKQKDDAVKERNRALNERDDALQDKESMVQEVENLTSSLFEEANNMVRDERKRAAGLEATIADLRSRIMSLELGGKTVKDDVLSAKRASLIGSQDAPSS